MHVIARSRLHGSSRGRGDTHNTPESRDERSTIFTRQVNYHRKAIKPEEENPKNNREILSITTEKKKKKTKTFIQERVRGAFVMRKVAARVFPIWTFREFFPTNISKKKLGVGDKRQTFRLMSPTPSRLDETEKRKKKLVCVEKCIRSLHCVKSILCPFLSKYSKAKRKKWL